VNFLADQILEIGQFLIFIHPFGDRHLEMFRRLTRLRAMHFIDDRVEDAVRIVLAAVPPSALTLSLIFRTQSS